MDQQSLHDIARKLSIVNEKTVRKILQNERTDAEDLEAIASLVQETNRRVLRMIFGEDVDVSLTGRDEAGLAREIGAPTPDEILNAYNEIKAIRDEIVRSIAITTDNLLEKQRGEDVKTRPPITQEGVVMTPTDESPVIEAGSGNGMERPVFQERLATLLLILTDLGIDTQEPGRIRVHFGEIDKNMMRKLSYVSVYIPELRRVVELCNEVGNRSFVWVAEKEDEMQKYWRMTKSEKDAYLESNADAGQALVMVEGWEERMRALLATDIHGQGPKSGITSHLLQRRFERKEFGERIEELRSWRSEHPDEWPKQDSSLGWWLHRMRAKLRNGKLSEAEAEALRGLGVEPAEKKEDIEKTFDERIEELRSWRSEHPDEWPKQDSSLGRWLHRMRAKLRNGKLSEAEAEALRGLGVEPAENQKTFDERIEELRSWRSEHPDEWLEYGSSLGQWLQKVRVKLRNGKLSEAEAEALRGLGVEPAENQKTFDERIEELRSWRSEHPDEWPKQDSSLGRWLHRMRAKLRNGKLSEAEAEALRGLGVEPAEKKEDIEKTFDERIEELRSWRSEHPDEWPKNDSSLGWWLHKMRVKLRNGKLSEAEADALTALGVKPAKKRGH